MIINKKGICRTVLIFKKFVIKFPNMRYTQKYFVDGMHNNLCEGEQYKIRKNPKLGKVYFCGFLGLFLIMKRYKLLGRKLKKQEIKDLKVENFDNHVGNVGVTENGKIIFIVYGNYDFYIC